MPTRKQDHFSIAVKKRLLERGWTVTELAKKIDRSRTATSIAINHDSMHQPTRRLIGSILSLRS